MLISDNLTGLRENEYLPPKPCGLVLEDSCSLRDGTGAGSECWVLVILQHKKEWMGRAEWWTKKRKINMTTTLWSPTHK